MEKEDKIPAITHSEPIKTNPILEYVKLDPKPLNTVPVPEKLIPAVTWIGENLGFWEKAWFVIKKLPKIISLIYRILQLIERFKQMAEKKKDMKTTITGVIKSVLLVLAMVFTLFGIDISPEIQSTILALGLGIYAVIEWIQGLFTKDRDEGAE